MFSISNMSEFVPRGGGSIFFKNVGNSKMSELSEEGGGGNPNWEFVPNFPVFF